MSFKIWGTSPVSSETLNMNWTVLVRIIVERVEFDYGAQPTDSPDLGIIACIRALRLLLEAHEPKGQVYGFRKADLERWKDKIECHLEKTKKKIPIEYRDGFLKSVANDLAFLQHLVDKRGY